MFNSIGWLISFPSDEVYRVGDGGPDHAVVLQMKVKIKFRATAVNFMKLSEIMTLPYYPTILYKISMMSVLMKTK